MTAAEREAAEKVCTEKEQEVLRLRDAGWSQRRIALRLGINASSVRARLDNADRKIAWALRQTESA